MSWHGAILGFSTANTLVAIPEITNYEVRREPLRANNLMGIAQLRCTDTMGQQRRQWSFHVQL